VDVQVEEGFPPQRPPAGDLRPLEPVEKFVLGFRGVRQVEDESVAATSCTSRSAPVALSVKLPPMA